MPRDEFDDEDDRPRRRRPRDSYDDEDRRPPRTTMPGASKTAGIFWIITGSLGVILLLFGVYQLVMSLQGRGPDGQLVCGFIFWLVLTLFGLMAGIRTVAGTSTEPIVNGVISLLFSLIFLAVGAYLLVIGTAGAVGRMGPLFGGAILVVAIVVLVYGLLLLVAGILVLVGRNEYVRFRAWKRTQRRADEDRRRTREYDEDDRHRPRRRDEDDSDDGDDRPRRKRRDEDDD